MTSPHLSLTSSILDQRSLALLYTHTRALPPCLTHRNADLRTTLTLVPHWCRAVEAEEGELALPFRSRLHHHQDARPQDRASSLLVRLHTYTLYTHSRSHIPVPAHDARAHTHSCISTCTCSHMYARINSHHTISHLPHLGNI